MNQRSRLIEKLVSTLHLNVEERIEFERLPLQRQEVFDAVSRALGEHGRFPKNAAPWRQGQVAFEGHFLEQLQGKTVRVWWQRSNPINPMQLAEQFHFDFEDAKTAVDYFVSKEWPKDQIDGIVFRG